MTALATLNAFRARAVAGEFGEEARATLAAPTMRPSTPSIEATPVLAPQLPTASVPVAGGSVPLVDYTPTYAPPSVAPAKASESKGIPTVWKVVGGLVLLFLLISLFKR